MTSQLPLKKEVEKNKSATIPALENGDRLTRAEFERRYQAMPEVKKAELIEGVVYMASPLRLRTHGKPHSIIDWWLVSYCLETPGVETGNNSTVRLDLDNEPQPDALLRIEAGQSNISLDGYVEGAPELIVEIAATSASYDLHDKLKVYRRNKVQEYIIWQTYDNQIDWYQLNQEEEYIKLEPDETGTIKSQIFPGLWLNIPAILEGNLAQVLTTLQQGINTPEHANFLK